MYLRIATGGHPIFANNVFQDNPEYSLNLDFAGFPLLAGSNVFTNTVGNAVWSDGGAFIQDTTMYGNIVYRFGGSLTINNGITLTIQPATALKFPTSTGLFVNGKLSASGTMTNPIIFTSLKNDTVGGDTNLDGHASTPAAGDWYGFFFDDTADDGSVLRNAAVSYGGEAYYWHGGWRYGNIRLWATSPTIENSTIASATRSASGRSLLHPRSATRRLLTIPVMASSSTIHPVPP